MTDVQAECIGYPINHKFNYAALAPFLNIHLNNLGDPYDSGAGLPNTRFMEREVLSYFTSLWHGQPRSTEGSADTTWGYVLSMGATEGNMYALWNARNYLSGKPLMHDMGSKQSSRTPLLFFSDQAHSSVLKSADALSVETFYQAGARLYPRQCPISPDGSWPSGVPSRLGAIDAEALAVLVDFFCARGYAPVILLNLGSTFKGAYDEPEHVWQFLRPVLERHGMCTESNETTRQEFWIHIDGALGAAYLPYLELARESGLSDTHGPSFDFRLPYVSSIVMSTHKWYGSPFPGGLYMTREKLRIAPPSRPEYYDSPDSTLASSRNGFSALVLWHALSATPLDQQVARAARCDALAAYAYERVVQIAERCDTWCERANNSLAVQFTRPGSETFNRFRLSAQGDAAHVVVMPHVDRNVVDAFLAALERDARYQRQVNSQRNEAVALFGR
ncbi:pyridoxal-dependent decarboxylase [Burkholderia sp. BCC1988]|uniref:pyridoxal-dependent decarboxylase n=1 Tax=Burkholderia sp. BCC1988 TaxID=2817443 RepID=UPI002AAF2335|nr:pyridoxal-dependent decarboxylase [Burkholderia sp. BCC1988]